MEPAPPSPSPLAAWNRPFYEPSGSRGDALLFYVLFGDFDDLEKFNLDRDRFRTAGLPSETATLERYAPSDAHFSAFFSGHLGLLLDKDLPGPLASEVRAAPACVRLAAPVPDPADLLYLRDVVGLVAALLEAGRGVAVLDALALRWMGADEWRRELWEPDHPHPTRHATILVDEEEPEPGEKRTVWIHTRGLRKFGRPDISVRRVGEQNFDLMVAMCNRFIELQARGGLIPEGQPIALPGNPAALRCHHAGHPDDPDFNNVHVEIRPNAH